MSSSPGPAGTSRARDAGSPAAGRTIHESIGHATELDRALGYEAAYAGTSFATPDKLGSLKYGSDVMNVTADRTVEFGLASVGFDDDGVAAQSWDLVRDGIFVGYQL